MSPRGSSSGATSSTQPTNRASNTPYSRRSASQAKSSRQQFSACGACRMRRVRCDLKDLPIGFVGPHPACSNCKERGIKCVDEFADVKAVKLLRRGRRLQQVEAIYGKVTDHDGNSSSSSLAGGSKSPPTIPSLHMDFFASPFWRWFTIQRPILDCDEFPARFASHSKGSQRLSNEGGLIAMLLVAWAASYGLNERGLPEECEEALRTDNGKHAPPGTSRVPWKTQSGAYLREILEFVDLYGVLRRPSLDGVRVLLLLLPLMEEAQPLERLAIYEATLSQVQALCLLSASSSTSFDDASVRARLFWYAYTHEGIITGIRGGRFVLDKEDLDSFSRTLPPANFDMGRSSLPSPPSPSSVDLPTGVGPYHTSNADDCGGPHPSSHRSYIQLMHATSAPLKLSNVCRRIHAVLTGIKATRRAEDHGLIDAAGMREIWRDLDRCWQELATMNRAPFENDSIVHRIEISQYVSAWQIFIFECHNVIREALKHFIATATSQSLYAASSPPRPSSHSSCSSPYLSPQTLHVTAVQKCLSLLPRVVRIIRLHTPKERSDVPGIFRWDAGLVRDGCFFAGYLAAGFNGEYLDIPSEDDQDDLITVDDSVSICLTALSTMRWGFSKSEEREETIRMVWENRKLRHQGHPHHLPLYEATYPPTNLSMTNSPLHINLPPSSHGNLAMLASGDRPMLPPLNIYASQGRVDSRPSTGCSSDGWPSYTPPSTANSMATSAGTGLSRRSSPVFPSMAASEDIFFHGSDMDQFTYNVPLPGVREPSAATSTMPSYVPRQSNLEPHSLSPDAGPTYASLGSNTFSASSSTIMTHTDYNACQFSENGNGAYH